MIELRDDNATGVSLFPMFNILACTLGVMVFVLATVATVSLGADKAVQLVAVESSEELQGRTPIWVEWDGAEMILHPLGGRIRFDEDLRGIATFEATYAYMFDRLAGTPVGAELAEVAQNPDRYVILLLRPAGFRTLPEVRGYLELLGIDLIEEPIDDDWRRLEAR
jgi:hypothetical protein